MAKALDFDKGLVEYEVNGDYTFSFNPTDEGFVAGMEEALGALEGLQGRIAGDKSFAAFRELDAEMRAIIDGLLGDGASEALFGGMNCYAIADGLPVWMNLFLALMDEVAEAYEREFGKTDARFKAHEEKYGAMMAKYRGKTAKGKR